MQIVEFLENSVAGKMGVIEQVEFLERFTPEKVSAEDIKTFVNFMTGRMTAKLNMPNAIDVCGTGGSGLPRINTSTISAFLLAKQGVGVAKHGNRSASGRFGSFDLLEKMGINFEKTPEELEKDYRENNLAFIFARNFHPAMKFFAEARTKIGKPTIFNILGPLLNPADPKRQIIGTSFENQMRLIAKACKVLGKEKVYVVRGEDGLDEVTLCGKTKIVELNKGEIKEYELEPADFEMERATFEEIRGGDAEMNTRIAKEILEGKCKSRHADLVKINMQLALKLVNNE